MSGQCMAFPETVEEFMEQYKIVDRDEVYSNGSELVPIFRMKQWFEQHPAPIRCEECANWIEHYFCKTVHHPTKADDTCETAFGARRRDR